MKTLLILVASLLPLTAAARKTATLPLTTKGAITLRLESISADVVVVAGAPGQVVLQITEEDDQQEPKLVQHGDRVDAEFSGHHGLLEGQARVELPPGSHVDLDVTSGDLSVKGLRGNVRVRAVSGDVHISNAADVDLRTLSGEVAVSDVTGELRLKTVSGDVNIATAASTRVSFDTASGDLVYSGRCGAGCRMNLNSCSGDLVLSLDPASSLELRFRASSGDLNDRLKMTSVDAKPGEHHLRYGKGEGSIEAESYSGDLTVRKR